VRCCGVHVCVYSAHNEVGNNGYWRYTNAQSDMSAMRVTHSSFWYISNKVRCSNTKRCMGKVGMMWEDGNELLHYKAHTCITLFSPTHNDYK
jgi:hypothetical protein